MSLHLLNLDDETRRYMVAELEADVAGGVLYLSPRLSPRGRPDYLELLREAAVGFDDGWLAARLRGAGRNPLRGAAAQAQGWVHNHPGTGDRARHASRGGVQPLLRAGALPARSRPA